MKYFYLFDLSSRRAGPHMFFIIHYYSPNVLNPFACDLFYKRLAWVID